MFYRPADGYGLPHNPFNAVVTPRPIGWISTRGRDGAENLAPYSFFNAIAYVPPQVMFASTGSKPDRAQGKDSLENLRETGVFCVNIVEYAMRDAMSATSGGYGREVDEVLGFVSVEGDEVVKLCVDAAARGQGVAGALLARGKAVLAADGMASATLHYARGNTRAERFCRREG